jgi:hypothetical protein
VLLKNDGAALPLQGAELAPVAVIGPTARQTMVVIVTFKEKSTEVDYVPRLIRNEDGRTGRIVVSADHAEQELVRITNDFAKKRIRLTVTNEVSMEMAEIDIPFGIDLAPLWAGALKIAYLTAFDFLGDLFLDR